MIRTCPLALVAGLLLLAPARCAELVLPQNRTAFYTSELIELAVAGLKKGESAKVELVPAAKGLATPSFTFRGDGSTVAGTLPAGSLAPSEYTLRLDGKPAGKLTVSSGVNRSTFFLSQTVAKPKAAGGNFLVGNAFGFGLLDPRGRPSLELRNRRSTGLQAFENAVRADMPTLVYMYWTGYVTHKPFGSEKSWGARDMNEAMRLLSFHTAQRIRRYSRNILTVGTLDEPGLSWGKTPAGGMASGFPNWDETSWYEKRGWKYTQDPAARDDADWMRYMTVRCAIMQEGNARAKQDLRTVWPGVVFSTDLYAPQAVMDGTDPLNQQVNDVPSSHVFLDWGCGKLGALGGVYLEKAHDPSAKLAHAMNGQLFAPPVPQPNQRNAYRVMLNAMLAAGLQSNWWLNPTGMTEKDLAWVNEPGLRLGPLFTRVSPRDHDVAVLWSFTEICMREKDVTAREAKKKTGEQIKLMIASLPDVPGDKTKLVDVNAYNVGGNYKEQVLGAHQALARAGYPAHIVHERILTPNVLQRYKALVVVGQTFDLPAGVRKNIDDWIEKGGRVVVDGTTKVKFAQAIQTKADLRDPAFRWGAFFGKAERKDHPFKNDREASYYLTNYFMDELPRKATLPMKETLRKTKAHPAIDTDSVHLAAEKHTAGEAALYMVLNAHDRLPEIAPSRRYHLYNYAPIEATFTLKGIKPGSVVYCIEGQDWTKARRVKDPLRPQKASFEPGEMKLYLVSPRVIELKATAAGVPLLPGFTQVVLAPTAAPCPVRVVLLDPDGKELYRVYRATDVKKAEEVFFPMPANAPAGKYRCVVTSPLLEKPVETPIDHHGAQVKLVSNDRPVRVFDNDAIRAFLKRRPSVTVAYGDDHKELATNLVEGLKKAGLQATARPEGEVLRKVAYPRVWNPFALVYSPATSEKKPAGEVKLHIRLGVDRAGKLTAKTSDGKDVSSDWRQPNSLVTIAADGFVDYGGDRELCYEPGVKLYFDARRQMTVLNGQSKEVKTTAEFRKRWARPWDRLTTHVGGYQLPPQLPEAYTTDRDLILLGDSASSKAMAALQASELLEQPADAKYPGPGKALLQFAWSPFAVEKDVIAVGASDRAGLEAGVRELLRLAGKE